jgi:hypothetical protein
MILKPIKSSLIESIGYDNAAQALHVKFKNGKHYVYFETTQALYDDFDKSESQGKFFGEHIRGKFKHSIVDTASEKRKAEGG